MDWLLLPLEVWDYLFRYHVVDEYDALRLAQTCTTLWEVYKGNGVKEWAWRNRWTREVNPLLWGTKWKGLMRWSDNKKEGTWLAWHYNNKQWREQHYVNGELHGMERSWYDNGQLSEVQQIWENGKRYGLERAWHRNGLLYLETRWVRGKRHGLERRLIDTRRWIERHWANGSVSRFKPN